MYNFLATKKFEIIYVPLVLYWILLAVLTSVPGPALPVILDTGDKFKHFAAYFLLAIYINLSLHFQTKFPNIKKYFFLISIVIIAVYGALDEIHQIFIINRSCEFFDWIADVLGGLLGTTLIYFFVKTNTRTEVRT